MYFHHKWDHEYETITPPRICYAVCATPRCGSSLLCELLCNTGIAGAPTEFFDPEMQEKFRLAWGLPSFDAYLQTLLEKKTGPNGVFGFKVHWEQYERFLGGRDARALFPNLHIILMTRNDRLGQAISFWRAVQSNQWASGDVASGREVRYDREQIQAFLTKIETEEHTWEALFAATGIEPIRVVYEELVADPVTHVRRVLGALSVQVPEDLRIPPPTLQKQADALSERWRGRFLAEARPAPEAPQKSYGARFIEHTVPGRIAAGTIRGVRVTVENTSSFTWHANAPDGASVHLTLWVDGEWVDTHKLPRSEVHPGERITVHFPFAAPGDPGRHRVELNLIEWNVTHFRERGVPSLGVGVKVKARTDRASDLCYQRARRVNPWHDAPTQGILESADGTLFPLFVARAKGCRIWDLEGREYVDYSMGRGTALLGHANEAVVRAVKDILDETGPTVHLPHPLEIEVAHGLTEMFPCAEMAVFGKNGSDACTVAARLARSFTGRPHILYRGYHGWQDFWAEQPGRNEGAIPPRPEPFIHEFRYNDREDFFRLFDPGRDRIAAVMMEHYPWAGDHRGFESHVDLEVLRSIADAAREAGALLIFDEMVTGFRHPEGSVQKATGVVPDLACIGKAIAGGMPLSAVVGRADVMRSCMPKICYAGPTFRGEIGSFAAAKAALAIYRAEPVSEHVWDHGVRLMQGIDRLCAQLGVDAGCKGPPFRTAVIFNEPDEERFHLKRTLYVQELMKAGVAKYHGFFMLPSYAHDEAALEFTLAAVGRALEAVAEAEASDTFHQRIEIPPVLF
jgi:glutamate-1-semialdehyde 2,1-aminomutase